MDLLLGIDIGTTGVKAIVVDVEGNQIASAYVENACIFPRPGLVEVDMWQCWWKNPIIAIKETLSKHIDPQNIKAIGVCGLYPAFGPTDENGMPLANAILYSDSRSFNEVYEVNEKEGLQLSNEELTPKLIWFLRHEKEKSAKMAMFFDAMHYFVYKITGAYIQDTQTTGLWGAIYESPTASWRKDVCAKYDIPLSILPAVFPPATIVGKVHAAAAQETGLAVNTPVITGMPDLSASLIAAGTVHKNETCVYYGTAGLMPVMKDDLLNGVLKPYPISEKGTTPQDGYIYDYPAYCLSTGAAVRWFRNQFGQAELTKELDGFPLSAYDQLNELAAKVPIGSDGLILLPYFEDQRSPWFDPFAKGVYFGISNAHTRAHLYRAIFEAFGYMIRHGLEQFYPKGHPIERVVATGGGAKSVLWRQIVSDITGLKQEYVPEAEGAVGVAYVAGIGIGIFDNFDQLKEKWVTVQAKTEPDPKNEFIYDRLFDLYRDLHIALKPIFKQHHEVLEQIFEDI